MLHFTSYFMGFKVKNSLFELMIADEFIYSLTPLDQPQLV